MTKRKLGWFYRDLGIVFSIFISVLLVSLSLCLTINAKANDYNNYTYYYNDYLFSTDDTISNFRENYFSNSYWTDSLDGKWVNVNSSDDYVYYAVNLDFTSKVTLNFVLYDTRDSNFFTTYNGYNYFGSFAYCDYNALSISSLPYSNDYFIFDDTNYFDGLDFSSYYVGGFVQDDYLLKGFVIDFTPNPSYQYTSIIFKFKRAYVTSISDSYFTPIRFPIVALNNYSENTSVDYLDGYNYGYNIGDEDGYRRGLLAGSSAGYDNGYFDGYNAGLNLSSQDYGIHDLLFTVFDIPFEVLSSIFSFTIFGANTWTILASIMALGLVIWLIRKFLK